MNPEQAITILTNATSRLLLNREDHRQVELALRVIQVALAPKPEPKSTEPTPESKP